MSGNEEQLNDSKSEEADEEMLDFHIEDNIFKEQEKSDKEYKPKKFFKKKKKEKGTDFADYAKGKGIDFNIEYENIDSSTDYNKGYNNYSNNKIGNKNIKAKERSKPQYQSNKLKRNDNEPRNPFDQLEVNQFTRKERQFHQVKTNKFDQMDNNKQQSSKHTNLTMSRMMKHDHSKQQQFINPNRMNSDDLKRLDYDQMMQQMHQNYLYQLQQQQNQTPQWNFQYEQMDNGGILISTLEFLFSFDNMKADRLLGSMMNKDGYVALPQLSTHPRLSKFVLQKEIIEDLFHKVTYTDLEIRESNEGIVFFRNKNWNALIGSKQVTMGMNTPINPYDNMPKPFNENNFLNGMKGEGYQPLPPQFFRQAPQQYYFNSK